MIQELLSASIAAKTLKKVMTQMPMLEGSFFLSRIWEKNRGANSVDFNQKIFGVVIVKLVMIVLVVGAVFFPRVPLGGIAGHYSFDLKIEDLILLGLTPVFLTGWFNETIPAKSYRVESCFTLFLIFCGFSIVAGISAGVLDKPFVSLLYLTKLFEYFLVFAMTMRLSRQKEASLLFLKVFFMIGLGISLYGYFEHFNPFSKGVYPNYYRLYERAPFHGDANHIGGLLAIWLAFASALWLRPWAGRKSPWGKGLLLTSICFVFFPFIWTFSRKSYFAFAGAYIFLFFIPGISRRRWIFLTCALVCAGILLPTRLVERLSDLGQVVSAVDPYHSSWACNLDVWSKSFMNFEKFWLFGAGLGARHRLFYESQYVMILSEVGVAGFFILLSLLLLPAAYVWQGLKKNSSIGLVSNAWLGAWAAFLIHNLSCVSLTVSKIAIPWWFLTAAVLGLVYPRESQYEK